jgi:hypothetical protein
VKGDPGLQKTYFFLGFDNKGYSTVKRSIMAELLSVESWRIQNLLLSP